MRQFAKGFVSMLTVLGLVFMSASPASATTEDTRPITIFAFWSGSPTNYCAEGGGTWGLTGNYSGGTHIWLSTATFSQRFSGSNCVTSSPANSGVFSSWARFEKETSVGSGVWNVCQSAPWAGNAQGADDVYSSDSDLLLGCGSGRYRIHPQSRIIYGGNYFYSDDLNPNALLGQPRTL